MTHPTPNDAMKDIERLIVDVANASHACGAWDDYDEPYAVLFERSKTAKAALLAAIGKLVSSTQPATDMGKRTGSTAPASSHGIPDAGESANKADPSGPQGARNAVANGGDARTETSGRAHPSTRPAMSLDAQPVAPVEGLMALVVKLADEAHANGCEQGSTRGYTMDRSSESAIESAILQYAERLASRTTIQTWQPIETAPKDGTSILGYWATGGKHDCSMYACKYVSGHPSLRQGWWQTNEDYPTSPPTHWMPLPPPPLSQVQGGLSTNNEEMK